ncbi:hypothetical protein H6G06_25280 [Anabaena sphaerica FACHB-251]|uniref:Uncharacterized protein n=1 Tax=Anabaena sphaerica FACHB-251 TaxID=2692883 RepID=A0A927A3G7_9NOST|nr:hypothetical protein [Anabaena sphaerica]MBD2296704.1 hypothetical protein [Anabaena sphaerica FACHB-251]
MLKKINSIISKNTEIFQQISDYQAAYVSGGIEIPIPSDVGELTPDIPNLSNLSVDLLNSVPTTFPLDVSSLGVPVTV